MMGKLGGFCQLGGSLIFSKAKPHKVMPARQCTWPEPWLE